MTCCQAAARPSLRQQQRWLLGTHAGAVRDKHLQAYLDEFTFRHNRRKTNGAARIAARVIESLLAKPPLTMRKLVMPGGCCWTAIRRVIWCGKRVSRASSSSAAWFGLPM